MRSAGGQEALPQPERGPNCDYLISVTGLVYPGHAPPSIEAKVVPNDGRSFVTALVRGLIVCSVTVPKVDVVAQAGLDHRTVLISPLSGL
ncbi:MAG TPA: hypothetical protein VM075_04680, partial [Anaerolineae bacterium]|nr:hypothetical protein [Anaerolineae bacterium]